jgi:hypothetical protein
VIAKTVPLYTAQLDAPAAGGLASGSSTSRGGNCWGVSRWRQRITVLCPDGPTAQLLHLQKHLQQADYRGRCSTAELSLAAGRWPPSCVLLALERWACMIL